MRSLSASIYTVAANIGIFKVTYRVCFFKTLNVSVIGFDSVGFQGDEHDFSDNIAMQQEVNRLRGDVQKLQAECQHWKSLVPQNVSLVSALDKRENH